MRGATLGRSGAVARTASRPFRGQLAEIGVAERGILDFAGGYREERVAVVLSTERLDRPGDRIVHLNCQPLQSPKQQGLVGYDDRDRGIPGQPGMLPDARVGAFRCAEIGQMFGDTLKIAPQSPASGFAQRKPGRCDRRWCLTRSRR